MLLPLFGLFTIAQASPSIYRRDTVSFPAVYVGQGFLNCGAPLVSDQCSTYPLNYSASMGQITFSIQAVSLTTINTTYSILSDNPQVTIPIDGYLALSGTFEVTLTSTPPAVRISLETSYTPTVTPAGTATATQLVPRAPLPTNIPRNLQPQKRSYDYDVCLGTPPDANLLTTSLVEVCHFVANAENYFVSMRPSSAAAYLPSWPGYIMQTVLCFMYFFSIVIPNHMCHADLESSILTGPSNGKIAELLLRKYHDQRIICHVSPLQNSPGDNDSSDAWRRLDYSPIH